LTLVKLTTYFTQCFH